MALLLAFGTVLLVSVSLSGMAARTVLSTSLMFLVAGMVLGQGWFGGQPVVPQDALVGGLADIALFAVLFTDGQRVSMPALREGWRLAGRALVLAMPMTMVGIALLAHFLVGVDWVTAFLTGAILSSTDPVFASAIVGRDDVPLRLRRLLNLESGLNDGLALPFVLLFLASAARETTRPGYLVAELLGGVAIGVAVPILVTHAWRLPVLKAEPRLRPLGPLALAITVFALCHLTGANSYLAAFVAGATLAGFDPASARHFAPVGDLLSELTKFAALLVFGALISPVRLAQLSWAGWLAAVLAIVLVRPASLLLSMLGSSLPLKEKVVAAWFGPKGFASVVYGLLVLRSEIPQAQQVFDLVAVTVALSIVLHSSTDVPVARTFRLTSADEPP